jgi:hypothetical protein
VLLLLVGFSAALVVFFKAEPELDDPVMRQFMASKKYVREMRMIGGQVNLDAAELADWIAGLWHGQKLADTIAVLTVGGALLFRFVAFHPDNLSAEESAKEKAPPPGPA